MKQQSFKLWKRCPQCDEIKINSGFPRNRSSSDGLAAYCKPCHNRIVSQISDRLYGGHRNFLMRRRYGIDIATFEEMRWVQGGKCALCRKRKAIHVDHDHATGKVRAILCFRCNNGLGKLFDDPRIVLRAVAYLRQGPSGTPNA